MSAATIAAIATMMNATNRVMNNAGLLCKPSPALRHSWENTKRKIREPRTCILICKRNDHRIGSDNGHPDAPIRTYGNAIRGGYVFHIMLGYQNFGYAKEVVNDVGQVIKMRISMTFFTRVRQLTASDRTVECFYGSFGF